jgi:hypothetical protein
MMRTLTCLFLVTVVAVGSSEEIWAADPNAVSPCAEVTVENWDKGGALSRWVYMHVSEVFPCRIIAKTFF